MNDLTLTVIYAIKHGKKPIKEDIIDALVEYTGTPREHYSDRELIWIIRNTFLDYLRTADNPVFDVWQYFDAKRQEENFKEIQPKLYEQKVKNTKCFDIDTEAIISALRLSKVKENGKFVNGFRNGKHAESKIWCDNQIIDSDGNLTCTAFLAERKVFACPYKDNADRLSQEHSCSAYKEK